MKLKKLRKRRRQARLSKEWARVRSFLASKPPHHHPAEDLELLDLCRRDSQLARLRPYTSMGRLCLERNPANGLFHSYGFPSLYFHQEQYVVAGYDNAQKWYFKTAAEAVSFARQHLCQMPVRPEFAQHIAASVLLAFSVNWADATARLELQAADRKILVLLSGVSGYDAMRQQIMNGSAAVMSLEYTFGQLWMWLHSGDYIRVNATGFELAEA